MITLARSDNSLVSRWWWTVDRWLLVTVLLLIASGILLTLAASPAVAERLGLDSFHFAKRQFLYMAAGLAVLVSVSLLSGQGVKRLAVALFLAGLAGVLATLFYGPEIKGATRWLHVAGFSIQPSEFLKPAFIVVSAWMLAEEFRNPGFPGRLISVGLFLALAAGLVMQPDFGQTLLIGAVWAGQLVMAGMPLAWMASFAAAAVAGLTSAYLLVPHVARRIDTFLDPASGDTYQIDTALNAIRAGGLVGRGPGEGSIKKVLPDAHSDFIFAVAGEEFGAMACLGILGLFAVVVLRGLSQLLEEEDAFVVFAAGGLLALFGLQALINISVNLAVIPAKGMTLPFISYGGSSMLALAITMGMVLALTRRSNARLATRRPGRRARR